MHLCAQFPSHLFCSFKILWCFSGDNGFAALQDVRGRKSLYTSTLCLETFIPLQKQVSTEKTLATTIGLIFWSGRALAWGKINSGACPYSKQKEVFAFKRHTQN